MVTDDGVGATVVAGARVPYALTRRRQRTNGATYRRRILISASLSILVSGVILLKVYRWVLELSISAASQ